MIITISDFQLPKPVTREEARSIFLTTAPTYQGVTGLVRKSYVIAEDGNSVGGVYLWKTLTGDAPPRRTHVGDAGCLLLCELQPDHGRAGPLRSA